MKPWSKTSLKSLIRAKAAVHLPEILVLYPWVSDSNRGKIYGICPQLSDMSDPVNHLPYSRSLRGLLRPVVFKRRSAEAQRIYPGKKRFRKPTSLCPPFFLFSGETRKISAIKSFPVQIITYVPVALLPLDFRTGIFHVSADNFHLSRCVDNINSQYFPLL